jgi:hypothetical protein
MLEGLDCMDGEKVSGNHGIGISGYRCIWTAGPEFGTERKVRYDLARGVRTAYSVGYVGKLLQAGALPLPAIEDVVTPVPLGVKLVSKRPIFASEAVDSVASSWTFSNVRFKKLLLLNPS